MGKVMDSDDELVEEIEAASRGDCPPPFGTYEFVIPGSPVSMQANKASREEYAERIRKSYEGNKFIFVGDLQIEFRWWISAKSRYETDASADIDNALKPTLDALSGAGGLFVDDCQVRSLHVAWSHSTEGDEYIGVRIDFTPGDWYSNEDIVFINRGAGLCIPSPRNIPMDARKAWCDALDDREVLKERALKLGLSYPWATTLLLSPRPFHRTRLNGFTVVTSDEYVNDLD